MTERTSPPKRIQLTSEGNKVGKVVPRVARPVTPAVKEPRFDTEATILTPTALKSMLPDVNPRVIDDAWDHGARVYVDPKHTGSPGTSNIVMGPPPEVRLAPGQLSKDVLGHEMAHVWQRYSWHPMALMGRAMEFWSVLKQKAEGLPYSPGYGNAYNNPFRVEGQASLYYGGPGTTDAIAPNWLRRVALYGYLR